MPTRCVGAILAGGASSRFGGAPKGLSVVGGQRIIDRVALALRASADALVLVASAADAGDWLPGVPVAPDRLAQRGSIVGIDAALAWANDPVLVVGWDMPFVTDRLLAFIRAAGERAGASAIVQGPHGIEGACAYYTPDARGVIADLVRRGVFKLQEFVDALPACRRISLSEAATVGNPDRLFMNVNTASDLAAAERLATAGP